MRIAVFFLFCLGGFAHAELSQFAVVCNSDSLFVRDLNRGPLTRNYVVLPKAKIESLGLRVQAKRLALVLELLKDPATRFEGFEGVRAHFPFPVVVIPRKVELAIFKELTEKTGVLIIPRHQADQSCLKLKRGPEARAELNDPAVLQEGSVVDPWGLRPD